MRLIPSDPDIRTIVSRIFDNDLNLQPDFQRGEVWGKSKKLKLIDSVLRNWHIPPIHVIEIKETGRQEVLDGQQRLAAIRDFYLDKISIDGFIEPLNNEISEIDGFFYSELPDYWKRRINKFPLRVYNITDYDPSEPAELFYRLNQPTGLTSAEQRNAYFGPAREQVKNIVFRLEEFGISKNVLGFSNSRMAYDDVIARLCIYFELGTLNEKITSLTLTDRYRSKRGFSNEVIEIVNSILLAFSKSARYFHSDIRFNKATLLSWFCFIGKLIKLNINVSPADLGIYISNFEHSRNNIKEYRNNYFDYLSPSILLELFSLFNDRASSRVGDISSVLIRDSIIWILFILSSEEKYQVVNYELFYEIKRTLYNYEKEDMSDNIMKFIENVRWGSNL